MRQAGRGPGLFPPGHGGMPPRPPAQPRFSQMVAGGASREELER